MKPLWAKVKSILVPLLPSILAILVAFSIGAILIFLAGSNPISAYAALLDGAFGNLPNFGETLVKTSTLLIISLGLAVAFRCRMFNIGAPGQLLMGALGAVMVGLALAQLPAFLLIPLMMAAGFLSGAAFAAVPAILKIKFDVHEVISTVLMNYIALYFVSYMIMGPIREPGAYIGTTANLPPSGLLPKLIGGTRIHLGVIVAFLLIPIVYIILNKTTLGYKIRAVGFSSSAAHYSGLSVPKYAAAAMIISGGLAGLAGMVELSGLYERLIEAFTFGIGFTGIVVAWLGRNHPIGIGLGSFLFGALYTGADAMRRATGVPVYLVGILEGLVLISVLVANYLAERGRKK